MHLLIKKLFLLNICFLFLSALHGKENKAPKMDSSQTTLELPSLTVHNSNVQTAASDKTVRKLDLTLRPIHNPSDIIKTVPGVYTATHAGGGKAYQYFMRGFDIDHGTDLSFWIDDIPINNVSHGHGQGYTDLQFIIPETIESIDVHKGPYHASLGNFSTAGALRMNTKKSISDSHVKLGLGQFNTKRLLFLSPMNSEKRNGKTLSPYIAAEVYYSDGPFKKKEKHERYNLMFKTPLLHTKQTSLFLTTMAYGSGWNASGQIPERAVNNGSLSRWGSLDPSEGGTSQRGSILLELEHQVDSKNSFHSSLYFVHYRFGLYSNFTFFLENPVDGDQIEQLDRRYILGFHSKYTTNKEVLGIPLTSIVGVQGRNDFIHTELGNSVERKRISTTIDSDIQESNLSAYVEEHISPTKWFSMNMGLRKDFFQFDVNDNRFVVDSVQTSGLAHASTLSPKLNFNLKPLRNFNVFLNMGKGFHSNDARGVVLQSGAATPLSNAFGYELGMRSLLWNRLQFAAAVWKLDIESELVWIGDAGVTEASGETERIGVDLEARYPLLSWLWLDGDLSLSKGEFTDEPKSANSIPNAPRVLINEGISWQHDLGFYGSLRHHFVGNRPLNEEESIEAQPFHLFNANLGYRIGSLDFSLKIENLLNTKYAATQFATESQLKGEPNPVEEVHFVPGNPISVYGEVKVLF